MESQRESLDHSKLRDWSEDRVYILISLVFSKVVYVRGWVWGQFHNYAGKLLEGIDIWGLLSCFMHEGILTKRLL